MFVGSLKVQFFIPASRSLKDRRAVVSSLKERVRSRYNASVAEVDPEDRWQRATLAVAVVGGEHAHVAAQLDAVVRLLESDPRAEVLELERDIR
ncbi:MAG TPA: DUF503 domain-containing protein [Candidatus Saccharimonadales bacterium]|nr:DUF503 domain-containing protein [Candidatus Saccharimonadales bacterium]